MSLTVPLFPLHMVLFPGGPLPLRIFEPRYLTMVSDCLRNDRPFGVVLITQGQETGEAARSHDIGTLARITDWDQGEDGLLSITGLGCEPFRVLSRQVMPDQLTVAEVELLPPCEHKPIPEQFRAQADWLAEVLPTLEPYRGLPLQDDADWLGYRLAELLPLKPSQRQALLEQQDCLSRLDQLARMLDTLQAGAGG